MSFEECYSKHKDRIFRLCQIMVDNDSKIKDLFQEVLLTIWKGLEKFEGKSKLETWIYRVVVNTSINFNLKEQRDKKKLINPLPDEKFSSNNEKDYMVVYDAIKLLDDADKAIIGLFLEGYQYNEIATILGLTPSNVGVRINRIKSKLKIKNT